MRVTADTKAATRQRILDAARQLFARGNYETSTTRDIAEAAGIAAGTLFNYFPTKEAVLASLAAKSVASVEGELDEEQGESLEEDLFAFVMAGFRKLKPLRKHLPALVETTLNPLLTPSGDTDPALRISHLETVAWLTRKHGHGDLSPLALQLYWTLYIGVLLFWAQDRSPKQEDTLALLDHSLTMFTAWLDRQNNARPKGEGPCPPR